MAREVFQDGLPKSVIEDDDPVEVLQTRYGNFAQTVLLKIREQDPNAPADLIIIGDNWVQLVVTFDQPRNEIEQLTAEEFDALIFADMFSIIERKPEENLREWFDEFELSVEDGTLNGRILNGFIVIDLASEHRPVGKSDLEQIVDTPWGVNGILKGTSALVYVVTSGYARQEVQDVLGSPDDDMSVAIFRPSDMVW